MTSILSNSILITGIVICMMSMIEFVNEKTKGRFFYNHKNEMRLT